MAYVQRDRIYQWRCQWGMMATLAILIVIYNMATNVWLLLPNKPCPSTMYTPSTPPTCEACINTSSGGYTDDPIAKLDLRLGRWDASHKYRLFDYAAVGEGYPEISTNHKVCLATQTSIDRLSEILRIAAHWSGPISAAVFVAGDEINLLRAFATWLFRCKPEYYSRMAIHVAIPLERPGVLTSTLPSWVNDCDTEPASQSTSWHKYPYPQNHLRNLARRNCQSSFVFLVDIDIVPSMGMAEDLDRFLASTPRCPNCAYVVPTYELDRRVANFPSSKSVLVRLSKNKLAVPFHRKVFIYNQYASNFTRWESSVSNESSDTHISHDVTNFELLYEPFYVAPDTVPGHDERFVGYGFTRNTQVYEMFLMGYQFKVLSPIFTIHWGLQTRRNRPLWREKQNDNNRKHFETFKRELFARYRKDPLHLLRRGTQGKKT